MTEPAKNIVIVGGGFAGSTVARELRARLPEGYMLILISEESYLTFNPMLPEVVGASIFPEQVVAPLRQMLNLRGASRFIMGHVVAVDRAAKTVTCSSLAGETIVPYCELVLAFGNRPRLDLIPGMAEHALPLKSIGDAMEIRNHVLRRLAQIELEQDPERRRLLGQFVVIGGGFAGVEVAGELADYLKSIRRYYPRVNMDEIRLTVLQDIDRLLPELSVRLGLAALRSLERRGVVVLLGKRAAEVHADGIRCTDGEMLFAATVVCTIGTRSNVLVEALGLAADRGRIATRPDLSVEGADGVWAAGDCALVVNRLDGRPAPPTAQFAVREARLLARNLLRRLTGRATEPFSYRSRHDGGDRSHERRGRRVRHPLEWAARLADLARLLPVADADLRPQAAHLCRMDVGDVLPHRRHSLPLYAEQRDRWTFERGAGTSPACCARRHRRSVTKPMVRSIRGATASIRLGKSRQSATFTRPVCPIRKVTLRSAGS